MFSRFCIEDLKKMETRQMGKVVQHCENILGPLPDLLRGVATHQTQIVIPI